MARKGIKSDHKEIATNGGFDMPNTGPSLTIRTQDGRNPESRNIPITNRTDHYHKESTRMPNSTAPSPGVGKVGNGPKFK